jgi:hypothetical protein
MLRLGGRWVGMWRRSEVGDEDLDMLGWKKERLSLRTGWCEENVEG